MGLEKVGKRGKGGGERTTAISETRKARWLSKVEVVASLVGWWWWWVVDIVGAGRVAVRDWRFGHEGCGVQATNAVAIVRSGGGRNEVWIDVMRLCLCPVQ